MMLFLREAEKQHQSHLLQLPAEIKTMILRFLLVHDGPLRARNWYGEKPHPKVSMKQRHFMRLIRERKEEVAISYNLSPEILATCQTLFNEGYPILYSSNALGLQICEGEIEPKKRFERYLANCGCGSPDCNGGMFVYAVPYFCTSSDCSEILDLVRKFDKLHVDINNDPEVSTRKEEHGYGIVRDSLLQMEEILKNKSVQVKFINPDRDRNIEGVKEKLADLMLIRCKEFKILNTDLPDSNLSTTTAVVTSDRPVLNLHYIFEDVKAYVEAVCHAMCPRIDEDMYCFDEDRKDDDRDCDHQDELSNLFDAAREFKAAEFYKLRAELVKKVDRQIQRFKMLRKQAFESDLPIDEAGLPVGPEGMDRLKVKDCPDLEGQ